MQKQTKQIKTKIKTLNNNVVVDIYSNIRKQEIQSMDTHNMIAKHTKSGKHNQLGTETKIQNNTNTKTNQVKIKYNKAQRRRNI